MFFRNLWWLTSWKTATDSLIHHRKSPPLIFHNFESGQLTFRDFRLHCKVWFWRDFQIPASKTIASYYIIQADREISLIILDLHRFQGFQMMMSEEKYLKQKKGFQKCWNKNSNLMASSKKKKEAFQKKSVTYQVIIIDHTTTIDTE